MNKTLRHLGITLIAAAPALLTGGARSGPLDPVLDLTGSKLDLAREPLFVAAGVDPNIMLVIDDSGSMHNIVPDDPYDPSAPDNCPASSARINPSNGRIDVRITGSGIPSFHQANTKYNWGTADDHRGNKESCFDPVASYAAALYGDEGGTRNTKSASVFYSTSPGRYSGHYLNWYFGTDPDGAGPLTRTNWGLSARNRPNTKRRMDIAIETGTSLVSTLDDVRLGLASFNNDWDGLGATIEVAVGNLTDVQRETLTDSIEALEPDMYTPLAESLRDIGRYFVGAYDGNLILHPHSATPTTKDDDAIFGNTLNFNRNVPNAQRGSPIQHFCQQNFAVMLTDGRPTKDRNIADSSGLTNYDKDCPSPAGSNYTCSSYDRRSDQNYEADGLEPSGYLDDVALALRDIDLRPDLKNLSGGQIKNNIVTYTIGFADDQVTNDPLLKNTALQGGGTFLQAENASGLTEAFASATASIIGKTRSSATGIAHNTGSVRADSQVYLARFTPDDWTGELLAYALNDGSEKHGCTADDPLGHICPNPVWEAGCALTGGECEITGQTIAQSDWRQRQILTYNPSERAGKSLEWMQLDGLLQDLLTLDVMGVADALLTPAERGRRRIAYLRGDRSGEQQNGGPYRNRKSLLGDIVNASPLYVGAPARRYPATWADKLTGRTPENSSGAESYAQFRKTYATRTRMVYAGANDGFLHGFESGKFDASRKLQSGTNKGKELIAYMPSKAFFNARHLVNPNYDQNHRFFVDGRLAENDIFFESDGKWHTILVGTLGAGGQGLFALDITDPDAFSEDNAAELVLWEFNDTDEDLLDSELGYTFGKPAIVRLHNGRWGVLVANGYNNTETLKPGDLLVDDVLDAHSTTGEGALYILDAETGELIKRLETATNENLFELVESLLGRKVPNGLASIFPVDKDGDFITDYVYAGDLFGQIWRFDLTSTEVDNWTISDFGTGSPKPLFSARDASGRLQPITTQVQVAAHPDGISQGAMVYFGTGKYLENRDRKPNKTITQSFYGIQDKNFVGLGSGISGFTRNELVSQRINATETSASGKIFRRVTSNPVDYNVKRGWYLDLVESGKANEGEMVISDPVVRGKLVIFPTLIPSEHPCTPGGSGYLMTVDARTGGRPTATPFDTDGDGVFTVDDKLGFEDEGQETAAGLRLDVAAGTPSFVLPGDTDLALIPTFDGDPNSDPNSGAKNRNEELINVGARVFGRESWRQLR